MENNNENRRINSIEKVEMEYKRKIKFEKTISEIATRFVNTENIDDEINKSLKEIGILSEVNRVYIFTIDIGNKTMNNTYEWCDKETESQKEKLQNVPIYSTKEVDKGIGLGLSIAYDIIFNKHRGR